jgi:hypothetical protein
LCQQGPLRYNSEISSYNPPTDPLDAGRPLKHRLPVKLSAMSSGDGGGILDSVAEASDDGQCSTVNDYSPNQHKLPRRNDEEDEKLEDDNDEAIDGNSGNDC